MAIPYTITISGNGSSGVKHSIRGTGDTRAHALAELKAKAAMTVMDPVSGTESLAMVGADYTATAALFATGEFADATLTLSKGVGYTDKVVRIANAPLDLKIPDSKGLIDLTDSRVTDFAAAYIDGDGVGGYTVINGSFSE